ncbi:cadmium-translocating P-type ATPase [Christensenellaceae bacterium OttesenSCG-928-K19]|nr:cadmium-translocating P-type ATPase [Christensenellaceae bacterium OttesenSCG-928-K19]
MENVIRKEFNLEGLCCMVCAGKIESGVRKLKGVGDVAIDFANQKLTVKVSGEADLDDFVRQTETIVHEIEPDIHFSELAKAQLGSKTVYLNGLCCGDCASKIEQGVSKLDGVKSVNVDLMAQKMIIEAEDTTKLPSIVRNASQIALEIEPDITVSLTNKEEVREQQDRKPLVRRIMLISGAALFAIGMLANLAWPVNLVVFLASYVLVGGEVVLRALKNISKGRVFDENFLMSVATIGAFVIGEYPEGVAVMLFYQVGEAFQRMAVNRSRKSIASLMDIRPDFANLKTEGGVQRVSPEEVGVGETIVVRPGEKVPLDGIVLDGNSALDTSALTGESLPRDVSKGDDVLSGSINKSGLLTIEVTKGFEESTVSKILELVQNASSNKAPMENFITKFSRYYTPIVVFIALGLAVIPPLLVPGATFSDWVYRALTFLVVSCPCALVISIPLSYFGGIGGASRNGILIKGSNFLEALNNVDTVVFDKTGTLTKGVFKVTQIEGRNGYDTDSLLELAALAESNSTHPIAESIRKAYGQEPDTLRISDYEELAGLGLRVKIDGKTILAGNAKLMDKENISYESIDTTGTIVYLAANGTYVGYITIADEVKADSKNAVSKLREIGVKRTAMLTGDSAKVARRIASEIGIDEVHAELLPQQKVEMVEKLEQSRQSNGALVFVGDGINDAPVLARSDIGIAMGGVGSDAAIEAADIVLMTDEPSKIETGISIAKKTRRIVWQNIIFAMGVKVVTPASMCLCRMTKNL